MKDLIPIIEDTLGLPPGSVDENMIMRAIQTDYVMNHLLDVIYDLVHDA